MKIASYLNVHGFNNKPFDYSILKPDLKFIKFERYISIAAYFNVHGIKIIVVSYWDEYHSVQPKHGYGLPGYFVQPLPLCDRSIEILINATSHYNKLRDGFFNIKEFIPSENKIIDANFIKRIRDFSITWMKKHPNFKPVKYVNLADEEKLKTQPLKQFYKFMDNSDEKYYLSTEPYYFIYRPDKNDPNIKRATLFDGDRRVDDICCSNCNHGIPEKDHHQVINYFEARLTLKFIK
jgi:hypothetical protein